MGCICADNLLNAAISESEKLDVKVKSTYSVSSENLTAVSIPIPNAPLIIYTTLPPSPQMNIAIMDNGANLVGFLRMDGAYLGSVDIAMKKVRCTES